MCLRAKTGWIDRDAVWGLTHVGLRKQVSDGGADPPREGALLMEHMPAHYNVYLRMSALRIGH